MGVGGKLFTKLQQRMEMGQDMFKCFVGTLKRIAIIIMSVMYPIMPASLTPSSLLWDARNIRG